MDLRKRVGIYPLNRQAISKDMFDPLALAKWEKATTTCDDDNEDQYFEDFITAPKNRNIVTPFEETLNEENFEE